MLFQRRFHERIVRGEIRCTVRIWQRPHVKVGGRYVLGSGAIVVDKIYETRLDDIAPVLARRCGFESLVDLMRVAKHGPGERVFVIDFHYDGKASARPTPATSAVSAEELAALIQRLEAMDRRSRIGPWTLATLRAIEARPACSRRSLPAVGRPRDEFKRDVRAESPRPTFSLEIGYRLTPKGEALVAAMQRPLRGKLPNLK
jgi:hypothetical protein